MIFVASSCSTSTKFIVYGDPGTQILAPNKTNLATIDNSGKVYISNPDDDFYAFLLSHKPGSDEYIPFALDYKYKVYRGSKIAKWSGMIAEGMGIVGLLAGTIACCAGDPDSGLPLIGVGTGLALTGAGVGVAGHHRSEQTNHSFSYKYLPIQQTNQDIQFTKPVYDVPRIEKINDTPSKAEPDTDSSSKSNKTLVSSSTTKTLKDNATKIEGLYVGSGTLKQGSEVIERYSNITISLVRKSKDIVLVNVIESDGSKFFTSDGEYTIKKQSNGKYSLTLNEIKNATIEIDAQNKLTYLHPRVNIDGDIYTLSITAKKKQ